ncbi:MFS transporter [Clostridium sp.]|jgi:FSR family fosmidomycin resistance protein-like MFS transporter|uniref:MFS transporter n=1 Tax=Clostridium sp. TaxID=1506 RepID=UPI0025891985|nr:MFS transporter [Clostridium sp.]MDF2504162.1 sugar phosphate permease [Clostridium sp.]
MSRYIKLLTSGHLITDIYQGALPAMLPFLITEKHLSYAAAAFLIFAANLSSSIVQPLFGIYSDKISAPWTLPLGILLGGLGIGAAGITSNYWLIAVAVAVSGVGIAAFHPEGARLANKFAGKNKATSVSTFAAGGNIGFAVGPIITTEILLLFGLKGTIILCIPAIIMSLILLSQLKSFSSKLQKVSEETVERGVVNTPDEWKPFVNLTATLLCRAIVFFGLNTFLPLYWIHVFGESERSGSMALSILIIVGAMATLIAGRVSDRVGHKKVVIAGYAALIPLLFIFINVHNVAIATALLVPIGFALYTPFSPMVVLGQKYLPNRMGLASGVTLGLAVTMGGVVSPLLGWISDNHGIHAAVSSLTIVPIIAVFLASMLPKPKIDLIKVKEKVNSSMSIDNNL